MCGPRRSRRRIWRTSSADILPVCIEGTCHGSWPTYDLVKLAGLEKLMLAMCDTPDAVHRAMRRLTDDYIEFFRHIESSGLMFPTNGRQHVGQGTWGFTKELPGPDYWDFAGAEPEAFALSQSWIHMNSQETVTISPDMFGEFVAPYYREIAALFGLVSYACCEPVDKIWQYVKDFGNLRKVSVAPWCDEKKIGDALRGTKVIYHRKPHPNYIGVGVALDEDGWAAHIAETLRAARGCKLEFTVRDVYSINHDTEKVRRAVAIVREQIEKVWK